MSAEGGRLVERTLRPWVSEVTPDAIQHYSWGIGDNNPRWIRPARPTVPPCFYYANDETTVAPGSTGLDRFYRSADWTWFDQADVGSRLTSAAVLLDESTRHDGVFEQTGRVDFATVEGAMLASVRTRIERRPPAASNIGERPEIRYDGAQLEAIEATILAEQRRGQTPRSMQDTATGDQLGPLLKGPLSIMDVVAWCAGTQGVVGIADEHSDGGLHAETATGPQQVSWLSQLVTDWMGDHAFLHRLDISIAANPPLGSTTSLAGTVTHVWVREDLLIVEADLFATSEADEVTAMGRAMVVLPTPQRALALPMAQAVPWSA